MPLSGVRLADITREHLKSLVDNEVREARRIDYKLAVGSNDEARREFLADVSSFANASGGDLLIGVAAKDGVATELAGVSGEDVDGEVLRLENIVRDGLDPRVPGIQTQAVPLGNAKSVLVLRVPRSWAAPHMVTFRNLSRFFSRNSAGKYQLDVGEIRSAFVGAESARSRLLELRGERLARIVADDVLDTPSGRGKLVLHLLPFSALTPGAEVDTVSLGLGTAHHNLFRPLYTTGWDRRITFDGALVYTPATAEEEAASYTLVFRSGVIESVDTRLLRTDERNLIASQSLEQALIEGLERNLQLANAIGVGLPIAVAVSLLGVRGRWLAVGSGYIDRPAPFDRDELLPREILLETFDVRADRVLRPIFDMIWSAGNWPRSIYYDEEGNWRPK